MDLYTLILQHNEIFHKNFQHLSKHASKHPQMKSCLLKALSALKRNVNPKFLGNICNFFLSRYLKFVNFFDFFFFNCIKYKRFIINFFNIFIFNRFRATLARVTPSIFTFNLSPSRYYHFQYNDVLLQDQDH